MPDESKNLDQYAVAVWESYAVSQNLDQYGIAVWESYAVSQSLDQYAFVVWEPNQPVAVCPNIAGSPGVAATFDASASTDYDYIVWTWTSVPGGSSIANAAIPFPDNGAATPIDMTDNEVLYHANEASGTTGTDTSGNGNNATLTNATVGVAGKIGTAWQNTSAIRVTPASSVAVGTDWTLSLWYYSVNPSGYATVLFNATGIHHALVNNTTGELGVYSGGFRGSGASVTRGEAVWRHLAVVGTGGNTLFYIDGSLAGTTVGYQITANVVTIAGDPFNQYFAERVDEIAVWSRALSASEIAQIYAVQSTAVAGVGDTLTFTPDVVGTYTVDVTAGSVYGTDTTSADAVISVAPPPSTGIGNFTGSALGQRGFLGQDFLIPLTAIDPSEDLD